MFRLAGRRPGRRIAATGGILILTAAVAACTTPSPVRPAAPTVVADPPSSTGGTTPPPQTTIPVPPGPASATAPAIGMTVPAIGMTVLPFVDPSRPTVSHGRQLSNRRALTTTVWYPQGPSGARPLVVFAHGYRIGVGPYRRACLALAERGFVVAAPSFPLTDQSVAGAALDEGDTANQPADMSFVITQVLAAGASGNGPLSGRVNPHAVAAVGHSDGADTVLALGYLPGNRDPRISAVVADAPDPLPRPQGPPLTSTVALLLAHGDHDTIAPFAGSQRLLTQLRTTGWFLVLRGADHLPPIQGGSPWTPVLDRVTADFLAGILTGDTGLGKKLSVDVQQAPVSLLALG